MDETDSSSLADIDIEEEFKICKKLFMENKISSKNVWQLNIFHFLKAIPSKNEPDLLAVAGTSLDIGAKVYSVRVDDIYNETLKLASVITSHKFYSGDKNTCSDIDNDETEEARKTRKRRSKFIKPNKCTTIKNSKFFTKPIQRVIERAFILPLESPEIGTMDNLTSNSLNMNIILHNFELLCDKKYFLNSNEDDMLLIKTKNTIKFREQTGSLCPPFIDFNIDLWNQESENYDELNVLILDENGVPVPELDSSINDIEFDDDSDTDTNLNNPPNRISLSEINLENNDYVYESVVRESIANMWAGPSHWKFKYNRQSKSRYTGAVLTKTKNLRKRRKPKDHILPNFFAYDYGVPIVEPVELKTFRKRSQVTEHTLLLPRINRLVINDVSYYQPFTMLDLLNKISDRFKNRDYDYINPNDSQYCQNDDDNIINNYDGFGNDTIVNEENVIAGNNFVGENLVEAPEPIRKDGLKYVLRPKKINVKLLKVIMWSKIKNKLNKTKPDGTKKKIVFSKLFEIVKNNLTKDYSVDLSYAVAFSAILHLCNEKNLYLKKFNDREDFQIISIEE